MPPRLLVRLRAKFLKLKNSASRGRVMVIRKHGKLKGTKSRDLTTYLSVLGIVPIV